MVLMVSSSTYRLSRLQRGGWGGCEGRGRGPRAVGPSSRRVLELRFFCRRCALRVEATAVPPVGGRGHGPPHAGRGRVGARSCGPEGRVGTGEVQMAGELGVGDSTSVWCCCGAWSLRSGSGTMM